MSRVSVTLAFGLMYGSLQGIISMVHGQGILQWHWEHALYAPLACSQCHWDLPWLQFMYK